MSAACQLILFLKKKKAKFIKIMKYIQSDHDNNKQIFDWNIEINSEFKTDVCMMRF